MGTALNSKTDNASMEDCSQLINRINKIFKQNANFFTISITIDQNHFTYNPQDQRKSIASAQLVLFTPTKKHKFNLVINIEQIKKIFNHIQYFEKDDSQPIMTPSAIEEDQSLTCCICYEATPTTMLPCTHLFCFKCTQAHIFEKQEKKCPICRAQFNYEKQVLESKVFTVVGEQELNGEEVAIEIVNILKELNSRQAMNIENILKSKQ